MNEATLEPIEHTPESQRSWLKDPLWVFLGLGLLLFFFDSNSTSDQSTIEITADDKARLAAQWQAQTRREPTDDELAGLVEQFIDEEVYYREAIALQLETNDTIIRRRLVQKLVFLTEDIATAAEPTAAELEDFYATNKDDYLAPKKYSFSHVYFSRDRREDAQTDALTALQQARKQNADPTGDPFILQSSFADRSQRDLAGTFGSKFAAALDGLPSATWSEPVESAYGWHLIKLQSIQDAYIPEFSAIGKRLLNDYQSSLRTKANDLYKAELRSKYQIVETP